MEFLVSDSQSPPVLVTVDGLEAVCPLLNCDYSYIENVGLITSQGGTQGRRLSSLNGKEISITGTDLPTTEITVEFGGIECDPETIVSDGTTISCTLLNYPAAGTWNVNLSGPNGRINLDPLVSEISVDLVVDSVTPNTNLNQNGGDVLTLAGQGFPLDSSQISITFSDGTACNVLSTTDISVDCEVDGFDL